MSIGFNFNEMSAIMLLIELFNESHKPQKK